MIQVLAILSVVDFDAFAEFESQAISIMEEHGGKMVSAFETCDSKEVPLLEFPDDGNFNSYRTDARLQGLAELRSKAISKTEILRSEKVKVYN